MNTRSEETILDLAVRQWFLSKPHLPLVRDYLSPRVEDLSLSHSAPLQDLQIAKPTTLPDEDSFVNLPIPKNPIFDDLKEESDTFSDNIEQAETSKPFLPSEISEFTTLSPIPTSKSSPSLTKRDALGGIFIALIVIVFFSFFTNTYQNGSFPTQSENTRNGSHKVSANDGNYELSQIPEKMPNDNESIIQFPSQNQDVPIEPQMEPEPEHPQQTPVDFVRAYYDNLNDGDADLAIRKWVSLKNQEQLRSIIENSKWVRINKIDLLTQNADNAEVSVEVSGRSKSQTIEENWAGSIVLEKVGGEWKISEMRLSQISPDDPEEQSPVDFVRAYYDNLNDGDADLAIRKWISLKNKEQLRSLIEDSKWVRINKIGLLTQNADNAEVSVEVSGRSKSQTIEENWAGTIVLEKVSGEWKISEMRLSQI